LIPEIAVVGCDGWKEGENVMAILFADKFDRLTRENLLAMVKEFLPIIQNEQLLRSRVAELSLENDRLKKEAASRGDFSQEFIDTQEIDSSFAQRRGRTRETNGERLQSGPLIDNPYQIVNARVRKCNTCKLSLKNLAPEKIIRRAIIELPEIKPRMIVTRQHELRCPGCRSSNRGESPIGLESDRSFGPRLEAKVVYLKRQLGLSHEWIADAMREMFGIDLSDQSLDSILESNERRAAALQERLKQAEAVQAMSEDGAVAKARRFGHRMLSHVKEISTTRATNQKIISEGVAARNASSTIWVQKPIPSLLKEPPKFSQLCLQSQIRDLQTILDQNPDEIWAEAVKRLFQEAIELREGIVSSKKGLTQQAYLTRVRELEKMLDVLLTHNLAVKEARKLQDRFIRHRDKLLAFLHHPDLSPRNPMSAPAFQYI
jgi:hypothetical protein